MKLQIEVIMVLKISLNLLQRRVVMPRSNPKFLDLLSAIGEENNEVVHEIASLSNEQCLKTKISNYVSCWKAKEQALSLHAGKDRKSMQDLVSSVEQIGLLELNRTPTQLSGINGELLRRSYGQYSRCVLGLLIQTDDLVKRGHYSKAAATAECIQEVTTLLLNYQGYKEPAVFIQTKLKEIFDRDKLDEPRRLSAKFRAAFDSFCEAAKRLFSALISQKGSSDSSSVERTGSKTADTGKIRLFSVRPKTETGRLVENLAQTALDCIGKERMAQRQSRPDVGRR